MSDLVCAPRYLPAISILLTSILLTSVVLTLSACGGGGGGGSSEPSLVSPAFANKAELGESLFFDTNLSLGRTQACSTCHDPERGFIDGRLDDFGEIGSVSLGDDGFSLGDRNTPTVAYAHFSPEFQFGTHARFNSQQPDYEGFVGGVFVDGRAIDLQAQAERPPLNPKEMRMPDKASVIERLLENADYEAAFQAIYGESIFDDVDAAYESMADAIAEFERTDVRFAAFDSKYDRSLIGDYVYQPGSKEALGRALFFSQQFTNCATCHQLHPNGNDKETFTNYEYHNIGVPVNNAVRAVNGVAEDFVNPGLLGNPDVTDESERGKYKVPTLRNIAITEPYMHNGAFRDLETVIKFYDHFLTGSVFTVNPETGSPWRQPQIPETVALTELRDGRRFDQNDVEAMVCFLRTLTDARYEPLIEEKGINCDS